MESRGRRMTGMQLCQTPIRGLPTGWFEGGKEGAPILLLLHGFPDDPQTWHHQVFPFLDRFRIVCPFNRGMGASGEGDLDRYGLESVALDLMEILEKVEGDRSRVWVLGHDIGAALAWHLAPLLGERCLGMGILNGMSVPQMVRRLPRWRQQVRSWYIYTMQLPLLPEWICERFGEQIVRRARGGPPETVPSPRALSRTLNHYRAFFRGALTAAASRPLRVPVLVLWGQKDPYLLSPTLDELSPFALRLQIRLFDGGHWIHQERAKDINRALRDFFDEVTNGTYQSAFTDSRRARAESPEPGRRS